jgi:hypothetical protein
MTDQTIDYYQTSVKFLEGTYLVTETKTRFMFQSRFNIPRVGEFIENGENTYLVTKVVYNSLHPNVKVFIVDVD